MSEFLQSVAIRCLIPFCKWIYPYIIKWLKEYAPELIEDRIKKYLEERRVSMTPGAIEIRVFDQKTNVLIPAILSYVSPTTGDNSNHYSESGIFTFTNPGAGDYDFIIGAKDYFPTKLSVALLNGQGSELKAFLKKNKDSIDAPVSEEVKPMHKFTCKPDSPDARDKLYRAEAITLKTFVDLRAECSPVVDQGSIGDCTSASSVNGLKEFQLIREKAFVPLSRLYHYYQERVLENDVDEDGGAELRDAVKVLQQTGTCKYSTWPDTKGYKTTPSSIPDVEIAAYKITEYHRVLGLDGLKSALTEGFPVVMGIKVYQSFEGTVASSTGVIPMPDENKEPCYGGHAVIVVGYDDAKSHMIVRNSWGAAWGDKGYFYLPYDYMKYVSDMWTSIDEPQQAEIKPVVTNKEENKMSNGNVSFNVKGALGKFSGPLNEATVSFSIPGVPDKHTSQVKKDGAFSVSGLPNVPVDFVITAPGFTSKTLTYTPQEDTDKLAATAQSDVVLSATTESLTALVTDYFGTCSSTIVTTLLTVAATKIAESANSTNNIFLKILRNMEASLVSVLASQSWPSIGAEVAALFIKVLKAVGIDPDNTNVDV
jgi:C1A family cysteine protease